MKVAITGITGMIGTALADRLRARGDDVIGISRRPGADTISWDPRAGELDPHGLEGVDAVVHLAGESIDGRWSSTKKRRLLASRLATTTLVAETIAGMDDGPATLVSASAVGYYGDRGEEVLTEQAAPGDLLMSDICERWEAAAGPAARAGCRVAHPRSGIVLTPRGGALQRMLLFFRLGLGGRLGSGRQIWSWISLDDEVSALVHLVDTEVEGPVNLTAPNPTRVDDLVSTLGRVIRRPTLFPAPAFGLRLVFGDMADELILASADVRPAVLERSGFGFAHPEIEDALRALLDRPAASDSATL